MTTHDFLKTLFFSTFALVFSTACSPKVTEKKLKLLIIDGQNNHAWVETTPVLEEIFSTSGRFEVEVTTTPPAPPRAPRKPKGKDEAANKQYGEAMKKWMSEVEKLKAGSKSKWDAWRPDFSKYDAVVSNYNGERWPSEVEASFEKYVSGGGGFVAVHAADNSFPQWKAYNEMIAVGGWGGRSELSGPYLRLRDGKWTRDTSEGRGGSHGQRHEFVVKSQDANHPIMKGLPDEWKHAEDELYDRLRGPAKNTTVLASAYSDPETKGSGENEPILMAIEFGKGRCFHTTMGHNTVSMTGIGFQETLKRGTEWVATGQVTFPATSAEKMNAKSAAIVSQ